MGKLSIARYGHSVINYDFSFLIIGGKLPQRSNTGLVDKNIRHFNTLIQIRNLFLDRQSLMKDKNANKLSVERCMVDGDLIKCQEQLPKLEQFERPALFLIDNTF